MELTYIVHYFKHKYIHWDNSLNSVHTPHTYAIINYVLN